MERYEFRDQDNDLFAVEKSESVPSALVVSTERAVIVPAHRLAEVVAAMYEAAGQPVPDLPVIHDQAQVDALARMCHAARFGACGAPSASTQAVAEYLLAHGVRLPEADHG